MQRPEDAIWTELRRRVDQIVDGEVFRCIELLSFKEQSRVAELVRSLLAAQLDRARAASVHASTVMESWQRVAGPLDSDLLEMARQISPPTGGSAASSSSMSVGSGATGKKRRRVEHSAVEDEDEFLKLAELGECEAALSMLGRAAQPRRLLTCRDDGGMTALHHAAFSGNEVLARRLVEAGAEPDRKTDYGFTAVMAAVQSNNVDLLMMLLQHRAGVNAKADLDGRTALHLAAAAGDLEICQALLAASADPRLKDRKGQTPTDKARDGRHEHVIHFLELSDSSASEDPRARRDAGHSLVTASM
mmetsp:Transcript_175243/g.562051  ORF Transcript_175243/g.562051 Transcript_175243/m.562051 type:complete len:304 (-) Transcript_175243:7-918(-)